MISTVDPEARHGHKTDARGFDGYKGHVAIDPDSEIITATAVTPGNAGDASVAEDLIADLLDDDDAAARRLRRTEPQRTAVYGDNAYGTGAFHERLEDAGIDSRCKTQRPPPPAGCSPRTASRSTSTDDTVTCPTAVTVEIRRRNGGGIGLLRRRLRRLPAATKCTTPTAGAPSRSAPTKQALARARHASDRSDLARRLPGHPPESRAQARPPHAPQARRAAGPRTRHAEGRRRLPPTGCSHESRPPRPSRARMERRGMGGRVNHRSRSNEHHRWLSAPAPPHMALRLDRPSAAVRRPGAMTATPSTATPPTTSPRAPMAIPYPGDATSMES